MKAVELEDEGFDERIVNLVAHHTCARRRAAGPGHVVYKFIDQAESELRRMANETEKRIADQPR